MEQSSARTNILKKISKALNTPVPLPFPESNGPVQPYAPSTEDLSVLFAQEFTRLLGNFSYCENVPELISQLDTLIHSREWKEIYCADTTLRAELQKAGYEQFSSLSLAESDASITKCEVLIARTGSMMLSSAQPEGRTASVYAPVHICIARTSQLVFDISDALQFMQKKYKGALPSMITLATGPSRTADIEKTLVVGVHGPKEVYCFLLEDQ